MYNGMSLCIKDMYCCWVFVGNAKEANFSLNSVILFTYTCWKLTTNVALSALEVHVCKWRHREMLGTKCWVTILHGLIVEIPEFSFSVSCPLNMNHIQKSQGMLGRKASHRAKMLDSDFCWWKIIITTDNILVASMCQALCKEPSIIISFNPHFNFVMLGL